MKYVEKAGAVLAVIGMLCCMWAGGRWMNDAVTEAVVKIGVTGIVLAVAGVLMTNFRSDWLFKE